MELVDRDANQTATRLFAQGVVGSQGNHEVELFHIIQSLYQHGKQLRQRNRARVIGYEHQQARARKTSSQAVFQGAANGLIR